MARQLFNTGAADVPDVLEAEVEARRAQLALEAAQNDRVRTWRLLAAVTGDPRLTPQALAGSVDDPLPEFDRDAITTRILAESPELTVARLGIDRARAALARAERETAPDLVLRGGPRYKREILESTGLPTGWEAAVEAGFVIPLFNRNQGGIAEAKAELSRSEREVERLELDIRARLAVAFDEYLTAVRTAEVLRTDVLPRATRSHQLYLDRYREMAAAYPQVLIAQRTLFQASDQFVDAAESAWRAATDLQGMLLSGGLMPAASIRRSQ